MGEVYARSSRRIAGVLCEHYVGVLMLVAQEGSYGFRVVHVAVKTIHHSRYEARGCFQHLPLCVYYASVLFHYMLIEKWALTAPNGKCFRILCC